MGNVLGRGGQKNVLIFNPIKLLKPGYICTHLQQKYICYGKGSIQVSFRCSCARGVSTNTPPGSAASCMANRAYNGCVRIKDLAAVRGYSCDMQPLFVGNMNSRWLILTYCISFM